MIGKESIFRKKSIWIGLAVIIVVVAALLLLNRRGISDFHEKYEGKDLVLDVDGLNREGTYTIYANANEGKSYPQKDIAVDVLGYSEGEEVKEVEEGLFTDSTSKVSWIVDVPEEGLYNILLDYYPVESRGVKVERALYINDELPFEDAANMTFGRIFTDAAAPRVDNQGNEIRPSQKEILDWQSAYCRDDMGYITEPYEFYFKKGENTLSFVGVNEPMIIGGLTLKAITPKQTYAEYKDACSGSEASGEGRTYSQILQGEDSVRRSDPSLYAKYDRSSPTTSPYSVTKTVLNYTGGDAWRSSGQWIEWNFSVPEDGYYHFMIKGRQNYDRGSVSCRRVLIDGEVPFKELDAVAFPYENDWNCMELADESGTPYQVYLEKGDHTIRLEATLGTLGGILESLEDSTFRLNQIYRQLLVYVGANPDQYRDYNIQQVYPDVIKAMDLESLRLFKIVDDMVAYSGQKAGNIATAQTIAQQLERFVQKPNKITLEFTTFKDNITALGTASLGMSETRMDVDYITVSGVDVKNKKEKAGILASAAHEVKSFIASFIVDYNAVGDVYDEGASDDIIKVWVLTGRDQGTILKAMVDDTFTPDSGIKVNVEVVAQDAVLNAVMAGRGPNVILSAGADQPVNYALRGSAENLAQFPDLQDVLKDFTPSSYEQYRLDDAIYGIPETQTFNVMFYREDVMEELGLELPNTWKELIELLPTIQGNNLSIGIPTAAGSSTTSVATNAAMANYPDLSLYFTLLYQYGGDMYNENGTRTTVDTEAGVKAFDDYTRYFNDYGIPVVFDFVSRFRSGEMPIGIMPYSIYNTLMVSAPEIRGLWDFTVIPGTPQPDGTIDRSAFITGSASMMITTESQDLKNKSWEFMKWWASQDTQVRFGREIEALLGSSARYATANKSAFANLAWSAKDIKVLNEQWEQTVGIREVPGGYFTGRHISNAIRKVINDKDDARETIIDYSIKIDEEIKKKRTEFGMPLE
ncbi:MAG: extracellular solute-binding protein [Clostridiales bacterium]|nr:extracellular solute-binding protein [Candidatus Blautia equi]